MRRPSNSKADDRAPSSKTIALLLLAAVFVGCLFPFYIMLTTALKPAPKSPLGSHLAI